MNESQNIIKGNDVISIRGLGKSFGDRVILKDIDLDVMAGENMAVMGRSGAGKSVLIKLLVKLLPMNEGKVTILGQDLLPLEGAALNVLRLRIGFSFQSSALYDSMSVRQNLEFPLLMNRKEMSRADIHHEVEEVLNAVGLPDKINEMPSDLSGGQKKRIGIARTLILKPEIMLYDEPTAGLDPVTCGEINQLILDVQKNYKTSSIVITHDLACAKKTCDRVGMLLNGSFIKVGKFDDVFLSDNSETKQFYDYNFTL